MKDPNYYADLYNSYEKNPKKIRVLDSTLREGEQHPGVSFTNKQRIQIAWMLDYFGVDQIEISPVVSDDHKEAVKTIIKQTSNHKAASNGKGSRNSRVCKVSWIKN
jgi:2-isopropylmalate synthase